MVATRRKCLGVLLRFAADKPDLARLGRWIGCRRAADRHSGNGEAAGSSLIDERACGGRHQTDQTGGRQAAIAMVMRRAEPVRPAGSALRAVLLDAVTEDDCVR
jgi:hypothetical protein